MDIDYDIAVGVVVGVVGVVGVVVVAAIDVELNDDYCFAESMCFDDALSLGLEERIE